MDMLDSNSQDKTNESNTSDDTPQMQADDGSIEESIDDQASGISGAAGLIESGISYPFRTENGAVTFRVVQVTQGTGDGTEAAQVLTTSAFSGQQVIASPFSNGSSPSADGQTNETRFTYFPAVATADGSVDGTAAIAAAPAGQFYVMMSPQDVLPGSQRTIAPRTHQYNPKADGPRTVRDERRRATHNEVERRRRDKINNWIMKLAKIVPDCTQDHSKQGQLILSDTCPMLAQSKGGILAKTCDYINDLRTANQRLSESLKESERIAVDSELLRQQCEDLKNENAILRAQLQEHGIVFTDLTSTTFKSDVC